MKRFVILTIVLILSLISVNLFAASATANHQVTISIGEVVAMALSDTSLLTLNVTAPAAAGDDPVGEDSSAAPRYLRYTTLNTTGTNRAVQARISASAPTGTALLLDGTLVGGGFGTEAGQVTLTTSDQDVITGVGSGASGSAGANGVELVYTLDVTNATLLTIANTTVTVTFTLTDAS
jgi:hypothetical protein